jgi:hypothetical protein
MAVHWVVDSSGYVSFAGTNYRFGDGWHRRQDAPASAGVKATPLRGRPDDRGLDPTP